MALVLVDVGIALAFDMVAWGVGVGVVESKKLQILNSEILRWPNPNFPKEWANFRNCNA